MSPTPKKDDGWTCSGCNSWNESSRTRCRNCQASASRLCRTPEECYQAGWDDGADDPPLTAEQIARLAVLLRPYLRRAHAA